VRVGHAAYKQYQLDIFGEIANTLFQGAPVNSVWDGRECASWPALSRRVSGQIHIP